MAGTGLVTFAGGATFLEAPGYLICAALLPDRRYFCMLTCSMSLSLDVARDRRGLSRLLWESKLPARGEI